MRSLEAAAVPLKIQYRYRPAEYGDQLVRMYLLTNDKDSKLGTTPLPDGTARVFRDNGRDGGQHRNGKNEAGRSAACDMVCHLASPLMVSCCIKRFCTPFV